MKLAMWDMMFEAVGAPARHGECELRALRGRPGLRMMCICSALVLAGGCGTLRTIDKLEDGAGQQAAVIWQRWIDSGGDIAAAVTWERKVAPGVTVAHIEAALVSVAAEENMRAVGELPLSKELEARIGQKQKFLKAYSYCTPATARMMVDFSPHMAAFLPCRIVVVEQEDGLWMYTMNMDMMVNMGRKLPPALRTEARKVRDTVWKLMERGAKGEF
jgi:uncharacterized protein (DUF302 family)